MPITYNLREQSVPSSSSSDLTSSTSIYGTRNSRDPRIREPHDDIILSDLVRGTGEASRLRRRGALLHRGERVVDRSSADHHQSTSSPGMSHYPLNVNQRHIQPQLPNTPGDGVLGLPSQDGAQGTLTTRPLRWSIFAPYEDESSTTTTSSTSTSMSALPSQPQPHQTQHSRFIIGPQFHYPQRQPQQPQPQPPPLFLPFPVTPPLDLDATRAVGAGEADFNEYTYVLRCGGNESDEDGLCEPAAAVPSPSPFVPSILPLSPSRPQQQASTSSSSSTRTYKRSSTRTNGCGTIIHYKAAPLSKIRTWSARTEATEQVVHLDSCYFDSPVVSKIVPSTCGCVREGVGCAVCGNPLGTLYIPCKTAIDLSSRSPRPSTSQTSSSSSTPPKLHIYSFFPSAVSSSPSYNFPCPSSPPSPSLSPSSPTSLTTTSSFTSTRRSSHPFLPRSRSRSPPSRSRSRSRSPSPMRSSMPPSIVSPPLQVVVPASTSISGHSHAPFPPYSSYPHRPHTTYTAFNARPTSAQPHSAPPFPGPARSDSFPIPLHTPLSHVHPYVHPHAQTYPQPPPTHLSHLQAHFFSRPHNSENGRNDDGVLGQEREESEGSLQRPIPSRRMEQLPPPIPIARTYSTFGSGGATTATGFFFGRRTTASPIPLSDDDDDDSDDDELVNDLHGAGGIDLADDEKEDGEERPR